jgi:ferredoxin
MTFLVTEKCVLCKYTDCVEVCPVDCFHEGPVSLVIDPEECIDCSLCVQECPVEAIISDNDTTDQDIININSKLSKKWPVITKKKTPLADADKWKNIEGKIKYLEEYL